MDVTDLGRTALKFLRRGVAVRWRPRRASSAYLPALGVAGPAVRDLWFGDRRVPDAPQAFCWALALGDLVARGLVAEREGGGGSEYVLTDLGRRPG